jgi:hypothetical protein
MNVTLDDIREVLPPDWRIEEHRGLAVLIAPGNSMMWTIHIKEEGIILWPRGHSQDDVVTTLARFVEDAEDSRATAVAEAMNRLCHALCIRSRFLSGGDEPGWFAIDAVLVTNGYLTSAHARPYVCLEVGAGSLTFQPVCDFEFDGGCLLAVTLGAVKSRLDLWAKHNIEHVRLL